MKPENLPEPKAEKASRRFSKRVLVANTLLAWAALFYAISAGQAEALAGPVFGLLGVLYGGYIGVGHLDYRKVLSTFTGGGTGGSTGASAGTHPGIG